MQDEAGSGFQMALWWRPGDDTAGLVSRCRRLAHTMRLLLASSEENQDQEVDRVP